MCIATYRDYCSACHDVVREVVKRRKVEMLKNDGRKRAWVGFIVFCIGLSDALDCMALACVPVVVGHTGRPDAWFPRRIPCVKKPPRVDFPQLVGFCTIRMSPLARLQNRGDTFIEI